MIQSISSVDYILSDYVNPKTKPGTKARRYLLELRVRLDDYEITAKMNEQAIQAIGNKDFTDWKAPRWTYQVYRDGEELKTGRVRDALITGESRRIYQDSQIGSVVGLRLVEIFASIIMFSNDDTGLGELELDIYKRLQRAPWLMSSSATGPITSTRFAMVYVTSIPGLKGQRRLLTTHLPSGELVITGVMTTWSLLFDTEQDRHAESPRVTTCDVARVTDDGVIYPLPPTRISNQLKALMR